MIRSVIFSILCAILPSIGYCDWCGTGNFINKDGYMITAYHVIQRSKMEGEVEISPNKYEYFKVVATSPHSDLALLKVYGSVPDVIPIANHDLYKNENLKATGYPHGNYSKTPTITHLVFIGTKRNSRHEERWTKVINLGYLANGNSIPGMSGGAYIDTNNNLIGTVSGGDNRGNSDFIGQPSIVSFLNNNHVKYTLSNNASPLHTGAIKLIIAYT